MKCEEGNEAKSNAKRGVNARVKYEEGKEGKSNAKMGVNESKM